MEDESRIDNPETFLKSKFQIGSIHGRMDYELTEKVFHSKDTSKKVKDARRDVLDKLVTTHNPAKDFVVRTSNGTMGGRSIAPWDATTTAENKFYAKLEREHHGFHERKRQEKEAAERLQAKKLGKWNNSSLFEKNHRGEIGRVRKKDPEHIGFKTVDPNKTANLLKMTKKTPSLIQRHNSTINKQRAEKLKKREAEQWKAQCEFERSQPIWNKSKPTLDYKAMGETLNANHTQDSLVQFLKTQKESELKQEKRKALERKMAEYKARGPSIPKANLSYSLRPGQKYVPKAGASASKFGMTSKTCRGTRDPLKRTERYEHLGTWGYNKFEQCEVWSCCLNATKASRGCSLTAVQDQNKWQFE